MVSIKIFCKLPFYKATDLLKRRSEKLNNYFEYQTITEHVKRILLPGDVFSYLIEGDHTAVLIDTGCGLGDLKEYVESLTDKPITVLLTHGHLDHAPGAVQFEKVYLSPLDIDIYNAHHLISRRVEYLNRTSSADKYSPEDLLPEMNLEKYIPLYDGIILDLGDYHIKGFSCGGHTPGSFVFLLQEDELLILGDACNSFTFLFDKTSLGLTSYENNLKKLLQKVHGTYQRVLLSHGEAEASANMISEVICVCEEIKKGSTDDIPFQFIGRTGWKAYAEERFNENGQIMGNIVYDINRVNQ